MNSPEIIARFKRLGVTPDQIEEQFVRSSGHGGQNVNKVSTCVQLTHHASGIRVRSEDSRFQGVNRDSAWERLLEKLEERRKAQKAAAQSDREKKRRQKRQRPRGLKEKILRTKKHRAVTKAQRRSVQD